FQAEDGIRDFHVTGVQTCALPIFHVISELVAGQTPSTKTAKTFLSELSDRKKFLVVLGREDIAAWKSVQNLEFVHPIAPDQLNKIGRASCRERVEIPGSAVSIR